MAEDHPIIEAVLEDPVVKAVLAAGPSDMPQPSTPQAHHQSTPGQVVAATSKPDVMISGSGQLVAAPTTTEEEERTSAGQRQTSMLWENTQARIALVVVYAAIIVASALSLTAMLPWASERQVALAITAFMLLSSLSSLVIGFYYGRTNHQKVPGGGVLGR